MLASVIPSLLSDEGIPTQKRQMYTRLRDTVQFIPFDDFLTTRGLFKNWNGTNFGAIDGAVDITIFREAALLGKYKPAKHHNSPSFYTSREVYIIKKNFFADIFAQGLLSLVETGIHERWRTNGYIASQRMEFYAKVGKIRKQSNTCSISHISWDVLGFCSNFLGRI